MHKVEIFYVYSNFTELDFILFNMHIQSILWIEICLNVFECKGVVSKLCPLNAQMLTLCGTKASCSAIPVSLQLN